MKRYITTIEHSPLSEIKKMLELIKFKDNDMLYIIGGLFNQNSPSEVDELLDFLLKNKNIVYILGYTEHLYLSFSTFSKSILAKDENSKYYEDWYRLYKHYLEKDKEFFLGMSKILKENPNYMVYLRSCPLYVLLYSMGFQYFLVYGSPEVEKEIGEVKCINELKFQEKILTTPPKYNQNYRISLKQGEMVSASFSPKEILITEEDLKNNNEIPVIVISACQKTGQLIKKGIRERMPILDTGSVIAIGTGGAAGISQNSLLPQLTCMELHSGEIYNL